MLVSKPFLNTIKPLDIGIILLALLPIELIIAVTPPPIYAIAIIIYGILLLGICCMGLAVGYLFQLQASRRQIERQKDEFLSFASHQLRTPLTTIRWRVEMLMSGDAGALTKKQLAFLNEIEESTKRMAGLVNQFLNISRINMGTFAVTPESCDIHDLITSIIRELQPIIAKRKLRVIPQFKTAHSTIICDPRITRILIFNILANAIAYTPKGTITITTHRTPTTFSISIADPGIGIPIDQQHAIFTKLFRADNIDDLNPHGSGLGLYIVKTLLDRLGGAISFTSTERVGTIFVLELPFETTTSSQSGTKHLTRSLID